MRIIDIHCHILPGMDDGASDVRQSKKMLRMAYESGIRGVIATPHHSAQFKNDCPNVIIRKCEELGQWAKQELDPEFFVCPGQEIFSAHHVIEKMNSGELLTLAGSEYILLEFLPSDSFSSIYQAVRKLALSPYRPVLAHVERYRALRENGKVEELVQAGALLQMNYRSIGGKWYDETTRWCRKMLLEGNVHFLATDMHNTGDRAPEVGKAVQWMNKNLDEDYLEDICWKNAEQLLLNTEEK